MGVAVVVAVGSELATERSGIWVWDAGLVAQG